MARLFAFVLLAGCGRVKRDEPAAQTCVAPFTRCGDVCALLGSDPENCGGCGSACSGDQVCLYGTCTESCGDLDDCARACVDLSSNPAHCGTCDGACATGDVCRDGACACPGDVLVRCGDECVDTRSDPAHCGDCENACGAEAVCLEGLCTNGCGELTDCDGACVDTRSDAGHCGGCGEACPMDRTCSDSQCRCPADACELDGACVAAGECHPGGGLVCAEGAFASSCPDGVCDCGEDPIGCPADCPADWNDCHAVSPGAESCDEICAAADRSCAMACDNPMGGVAGAIAFSPSNDCVSGTPSSTTCDAVQPATSALICCCY